MRALLAEDDAALRNTLVQVLEQANFGVDSIANGRQADTALLSGSYDLVILDLGLPDMDGLEVLRRLRSRKNLTPVLVLTARDDIDSRVEGLDLGADDYLVKPFALPELEARIRALTRRATGASPILRNGPLQLDFNNKQALLDGKALEFSAREITLLQALMCRIDQVVLKSRLAQQLSAWEAEIGTNAVEVYIHRLRKKLEKFGLHIRTVHGLGYVLESYNDNPEK
ncbi:MAG TPA: response regulator [Pseudomonadales bacterium]|nr:response regulator [Pseudomonadales bacterium]